MARMARPSTTSPSATETSAAPISTQITRLLNCPARRASGEMVLALTQRVGSALLQALCRLGGCQTLLDIRAELCSEYRGSAGHASSRVSHDPLGCTPVITAWSSEPLRLDA